MKRIAIIGGGIAGLSAAFYLERARRGGAAIEWALFEKSERLGGVIKTERRDGFVLEAGPDSFLTIKPDGAQFCRDLGIAGQLISSNDAERKTYIVVKGRLVPIPEGLEFMVPTRVLPMATTPLFSWSTKLRMAREWFSGGGNQNHDESVAEFVRRHFGQEMVDRVAEPLLAGVYGGNADKMSVRAVLPRFAEMERESGSLVRATLKARRARKRSSSAPQPLFTSLKNGMQEMVDGAVAVLPPERLRLEKAVNSVRPVNDDWQIESGGRMEKFQAVVLAAPAVATAALMRQIHPGLIEGMGRISYSSSAAVLLAYDKAALPPGHGFLVPRTEGRKLLACTFVHKKFPHRAPAGAALLRCFISSSRVPDLMGYTDDALLAAARKEIENILGLAAEPLMSRVFRWDCALPQYETGHLERVAEMEKILAEMPGLYIAGNSLYGIGIPDCIKSGKAAAEKLLS
ncbi:MAG TPA: protoporphyrinogen oxidase [Candidatus Angelobacter sp.]